MYQVLTGIAGAPDVINHIAEFAEDVGWTVHKNTLVANQRNITISPAGGPTYTSIGNLDGANARLDINIHRGLNLAANWNLQPDQYYQVNTQAHVALQVLPAVAIYAFGALNPTPYLYFAIELAPNYYRHVCIGNYVKWSNMLGGAFMTTCGASSSTNSQGSEGNNCYPFIWRQHINPSNPYNGGMEVELPTGQASWVKFARNQGGNYYYGGCDPLRAMEEMGHINTFDQSTELYTPELQYRYGDVIYDVGYPANLRYLDMTNYQPKDELSIGADVWKLFPIIRKASPSLSGAAANGVDKERSLNYAIAYLKA